MNEMIRKTPSWPQFPVHTGNSYNNAFFHFTQFFQLIGLSIKQYNEVAFIHFQLIEPTIDYSTKQINQSTQQTN